MFIASKYEEIYPPDVNEFVYITDESYDKAQVLKMEMLILKVGLPVFDSQLQLLTIPFPFSRQTLDMTVSYPTTHYFLRRLIAMARPFPQVAALSEYLCYLSLMQAGSLLHYYPSEIAFSSLLLAAHTLGEEEQLPTEFLTRTLQSMSDAMHEHDYKFTKSELQDRLNDCMAGLLELHKSAGTMVQKSVQAKYSLPKYFAIANAECLHAAPRLN